MSRPALGRRWQAPEVVQTSAMDCGPAALKCLLEGFHVRVSYGRLREACQTDLDGTSIDTLEAVAPQLGLAAEQVLLPLDHAFGPAGERAGDAPAIVVVRQPDGAAHFVVVWRRLGGWLQVMDPARGRRWVRLEAFVAGVHRHEHRVPEADWRQWAASEAFGQPLLARLRALGAGRLQAQQWLAAAQADPGWFGCGVLDACTRLVQRLVDSGGVARGRAALRLLQALGERCRSAPGDIFATVPAADWAVTPDPDSAALGALHLRLHGAVMLRVQGRLATPVAHEALSPELAAALREPPAQPLRQALALLREAGRAAPLALAGALGVAAAMIVVESLLLRGLLDLGTALALPGQRVTALAALLAFAALLLAFEVPIVRESMRHGRHLETRLRMALLDKLPRLHDRYFHSRSVSDMAERAHALHAVRQLPVLAMNLVQSGAELAFTLMGVAWIAPAAAPWALALAAAALALPLLLQPLLAERDMRVRQQGAALHASTLDALLGPVPLRVHAAQPALARQHEAHLVAWVGAARRLIAAGLAAQGTQALLCNALAATQLVQHFGARGAIGGGDLLLVYWTLKLPALGGGLAGLLRQWPAQRNVLARLLEPLSAPEAPEPGAEATGTGPVALRISGGRVVAAGHEILGGVDLQVAAGEHVAVVGASGAGKSSLLGLLLGWHRLAAGELSVDGGPGTRQAPAALRRDTAWVDPAVQLWNRPLLDNLLYASDDAALARVAEVIATAGLRPVLQKLPAGLQTPLGEGGACLSGGEGQRVRLGRALLQAGSRLVLLDEPFRGLDRGQRATLLAGARRAWQGTTLLCVTHDVGETLAFDRVLVVDGGRIVEDGAPAALAARPSRYAALLQAEAELRQGLWAGADWRHLRLEEGRVVEAKVAA